MWIYMDKTVYGNVLYMWASMKFLPYPDNSLPGQFAPDLQTTRPSFFYPQPLLLNIRTQDLQSYKLFFVILSTTESEDRERVVWSELSGGGELFDIWHNATNAFVEKYILISCFSAYSEVKVLGKVLV